MDNDYTNRVSESAENISQDSFKFKNVNLQDLFLNYARKEKIILTIYLVNGFQLRGIVRGFDSYSILFESDGKLNMVYKHAISTIQPSRPINIF
ncbi:MAG: RNA chaperone Hfq [Clostridia bacterium]|nr:RNA chaperone Hfq [Clostridia bacterium]